MSTIKNVILSKDGLTDELTRITDILTSFWDLPDDNWIHDISIEFVDRSTAFVNFGDMTIYVNYDHYLKIAGDGLFPEYKSVVSKLKLPNFRDWDGDTFIPTFQVGTWLLLHELGHILTDNEMCRTGDRYAPHGKEFRDNYYMLLEIMDVSIRVPVL